MLPPGNRLRRRSEFTAAVRRGRRSRRGSVVVHLLQADGEVASAEPARVGLVVGRGVGPAVVRNRVKRRLRHVLNGSLASLPPGSRLVVRATPGAATATSSALATDVQGALGRVLRQPPGASR